MKVVLVGDSGVGKTNIMSKYLKNEFREDSKATVGVEFGSKQFNIQGHQVKAQIWDTAGQERFKNIQASYYKGANGILVVYDITNRESFEHLNSWLIEIEKNGNKNVYKLLIGNKSDLERKTKKKEEKKEDNEEIKNNEENKENEILDEKDNKNEEENNEYQDELNNMEI